MGQGFAPLRGRKVNTTRRAAAALTRVALVCAIIAAVWGVYRRLPADSGPPLGGAEHPAATALRIRLRGDLLGFPVDGGGVSVRLYSINMEAARSEFFSERRPGQTFNEFAVRQMGARQPVTAELDERGETVVLLPPGRWWVHAAVGTERELTWRLPVNVAGREKTVELTPENAYARAQRF